MTARDDGALIADDVVAPPANVKPLGAETVIGAGNVAPTMTAPLASSSFTMTWTDALFPMLTVEGTTTRPMAAATGANVVDVPTLSVSVAPVETTVIASGPDDRGVPLPSGLAYVVTTKVSTPVNAGISTVQVFPPGTLAHEASTFTIVGGDEGGTAPSTEASVNTIDCVPLEMYLGDRSRADVVVTGTVTVA